MNVEEALERIRALEVELAFWLRESTKWNQERDALKAELVDVKEQCLSVEVQNDDLRKERDNLQANWQTEYDSAQRCFKERDALKARVADLERHANVHLLPSIETCNCIMGGGRESGKPAESERSVEPADAYAAANPAACPYCGARPGELHAIAEFEGECGG